jgi:chitodextrinase
MRNRLIINGFMGCQLQPHDLHKNITENLIVNIRTLLFSLFVLNNAITFAADEIHWTFTGQTSVTFDWRGTSAENIISYGTNPGVYTHSITAQTPTPLPYSSAGPFWEAKLTGLQENTRYYYSIGDNPEHTFHTSPTPGRSGFSIFAQGDIGDTGTYFRMGAIQDLIANGQPDFVVGLGDLTYGNAHGQEAVDQHFNDVMVWSQDAAYMPLWGNHEWDKSTDDLRNYKGRFELPNPQTSPNSPRVSCCGEDWYWFDYGNVRFITLPEPWSGAWSDWNTQATVLMEEAEENPNITFIVTFVHRPAYSSGHHPGSSTLKRILDALGDRFNKYVLNANGHSHNYERTHPQHGVVHITAGASGSSLETDGSCLWLTCTQPSWSAFRAMHLGVLKLHFTSDGIQGSFICGPPGAGKNDVICNQGDILDRFTIGSPSTDNTSPSVPSNLGAIAVSATQIDLSWLSSTDNVSVSGYRIYRDNVQIGATPTTSYSSSGLSPSTSYTYTVVAFDDAGNISKQSLAVTSTTLNASTEGKSLLFTPTDDATIKPGSPATNFGSKKLETDKSSEENFLMKFNISGVSGRSIISAKLRLYNINGSSKGGDFYRVAENSWSESTINWNNAPDAEQTAIASLGAVSAGNWYEVDLSSLITEDGVYSLRIISTSSNGADYNSKEDGEFSPQLIVTLNHTVTPDSESPSVPANLNTTAVSTSQIDLFWSASTDNIGVRGYTVFRDGAQIGTTSTMSYSDTELSSSTSYTYAVTAFDKAGNISEKSAIAAATTLNPGGEEITLTFSPTDDATIKPGSPTSNFGSKKLETDKSSEENFLMKFTISGLKGQSVTSAKLRLYNINGSNKGGDFFRVADNSWSEATITWNNAPVADNTAIASLGAVASKTWYEVDLTSLITKDGIYSLRVTSTSKNGADYKSKEAAEFAPQLIVVKDNATTSDTTPPSVSILEPGFDSTVSNMISVTAKATDNVKVRGVQFKLDGNNISIEDTTNAFAVSLDTMTIPDGAHSLTAVARDYAGNIKTSSPVTILVNNYDNPPAQSFITDPNLIFSVPQMANLAYLSPSIDPTFGSTVVRIANDTGKFTSPVNGVWGSDARHHYSKDQPWNSDNTLLAIQNSDSPSQLILDGSTYQPKHGKCNNYSSWDDRWHPGLQHPHERINVNHDKLEWFDVVHCTQTRNWILPFSVNYMGSGEGNTSFDGRYLLLADATRMFIVDMDPQEPYKSYLDGNNNRIGPAKDISECGLNDCSIDWVSISPSGKYAVVSYNGDHLRVFNVDGSTLALTPRPMPIDSEQCSSHDPAKGYIYDLGHADMTLNPFDNNEDVIIGQRRSWCPGTVNGTEMGSVIMVRLKDNVVTSLTNPTKEATAHHISTRNYDRPGWVYVSYYPNEENNHIFSDEIVAVKIDGSLSVERLVHKHSNNDNCYRCEAHAVPSRDGRRVLWAAGSSSDIKAYVVDIRP